MKVTVTVLFLAVLLNVYVHPAPTPGHESDFLQEWKNDDNPCVHDVSLNKIDIEILCKTTFYCI